MFFTHLCKNIPVMQIYGEICIQVKKKLLELDMEQQTDSRLVKEYIKAV